MQPLSNGAVSHVRNQTPWDTRTQKHTLAQSPAPTVCSEWNQWVPKGLRVDFYVYAVRLQVKRGIVYGGEHIEQENRVKEEWRREFGRVSWHWMHCGALLPRGVESKGSALQREYAWRAERGSGNNKVVKSLSPQAPCTAHLDLMAGVLSLSLWMNTPRFSLLSSNL